MSKDKRELVLKYIFEIEDKVYSGVPGVDTFSDIFCGIPTWKELLGYLEAKPKYFLFDGGYLLYTEIEIVDLASTKPLSLSTLLKIKEIMVKEYKGKEIEVRCRKSTSYKLIQRLIKNKTIRVVKEEEEIFGEETFFEMVVFFN